MSVLQRLSRMIRPNSEPVRDSILSIPINQGVVLYPDNDTEVFVEKGYKKNAWVYSIVSRCAEKFGQVPFYHYRLKTSERKTYRDAQILLKREITDPKARKEAKRMIKSAVEEERIDSALQKFLDKPNGHQSGAKFRENLRGFQLLQGEGNQWLSRLDKGKAPVAVYAIPRSCLALVKGVGPWDIQEYELIFNGLRQRTERDNMLMWTLQNYEFDPLTLQHMRGMAPLESGLLLLQASNEGAETLLTMNKQQGAKGLAFRKDSHDTPTAQQALFQRQQFDSIVMNKERAGSVAVMNGDWNYIQFGLDATQLQLLEQTDVTAQQLCHIFNTPPGLFAKDQTYENAKQYYRTWIYQNIFPAVNSLCEEWNNKIIPQFGLDNRDVIHADILALPELAVDVKEMAEAYAKLWQMTPNEVREALGFEKSEDANMDKVYMPSGLRSMDDVNSDTGMPDLTDDLNDLNA